MFSICSEILSRYRPLKRKKTGSGVTAHGVNPTPDPPQNLRGVTPGSPCEFQGPKCNILENLTKYVYYEQTDQALLNKKMWEF